MDIGKLIERLYKHHTDWGEGRTQDFFEVCLDCKDAATALSAFQAENEEMQKHLNEFSEFLCHMTGGLLSKTNYTAQEMISAAEDYQQNVCGECDLRAENEKLRAELENYCKGHCSEGGCAAEKDRDAVLAELEQVKRLYESEKEDFIDFACSGVPNLTPYCLNRHPDCVDERGWCRTEKCRGFSRERGPKKEG